MILMYIIILYRGITWDEANIRRTEQERDPNVLLIDEPKTPYAYSINSEEESETSVNLSSNFLHPNFFHTFSDQPSLNPELLAESASSDGGGDRGSSIMMSEEEPTSHVSFDEGEHNVLGMGGDEMKEDEEVIDVHDADQYTPSSEFVHKRKEHYSMKEAMKLAKRLLSNEEGTTS